MFYLAVQSVLVVNLVDDVDVEEELQTLSACLWAARGRPKQIFSSLVLQVAFATEKMASHSMSAENSFYFLTA